MSNSELARIFGEIADMLDILGEVVYKAVAYRRVADAVERYPDVVAALFRRGTPPKLPGAGPALTAKLAELSETGRLEYHERLRAQVPSGLLDMLRIPLRRSPSQKGIEAYMARVSSSCGWGGSTL